MKTTIKLIGISVLLLLMSTITTYGIGIETTITDITYDDIAKRFDFLIRMRKGTNYIPDDCNGDFAAIDFRFDICAQPGVVFAGYGTPADSSKLKLVGASINPAMSRLNITGVSMNNYPYQPLPDVTNSYVISIAREPYAKSLIAGKDLDDTFVIVAGVSLYVKSGTPTAETKIKIRTADRYSSLRTQWSNGCGIVQQDAEPFPQNDFSLPACPGVDIWTGEVDSDWNNFMNWSKYVVPEKCFDIYIPGNLGTYPQLTSDVECNNIYFIQGAELGRPDFLKYEKAYVHLNFGLKQFPQLKSSNKDLVLNSDVTIERLTYSAEVSSAPLNRERWYMLSSPLRKVVTGDLGFGGFPITFLKKFGPVDKDNINYPVGKWTTTYNSMVEPVASSITDGFAFYMYGYGMSGDNAGCEESGSYLTLNDMSFLLHARDNLDYGFKEANGIIELPFFEDISSIHAHRTQVYNPTISQSEFFDIDDGTFATTDFNRLIGTSETIIRETGNSGNYRFAPETYNGTDWVFPQTVNHPGTGISGDDEFLVGNPYMSSIDMVEFINDNTATILPQFRVWNGTTFTSVSILGNTVVSSDPAVVNPGYIAPMQGFFLRTVPGYIGTGNVAKFDVSKISTTRPSGVSNLRSGNGEENILRIKAENNFSASQMLIAYKENVSDGFNMGEDVQKFFSFMNYVPEIYALAGDIPTDIRFINNKKETIVPLGIKTELTGEIRLTFTGMDNYFKASKIELIDVLENRTVDLTGLASYTYTFIHAETGIQNGRFLLRIGASLTALPDVIYADGLKVYGDTKGIYVVTPSSDPVQQVIIYDFQGRKLYESTSSTGYYPLHRNPGNIPLIVKVITKSQTKTVKLNNSK